MKIVVKEIDRYKSKNFPNKFVSEFIIYLMTIDGDRLYAYTEIGEKSKNSKVKELVKKHFTDLNEKEIIEEIYI